MNSIDCSKMRHTNVLGVLVICSIGITAIAAQCLSADDKTPIDRDAKSRLYKGHQLFTLDFLSNLNKAKPNENVFFSPYSLYHALLLAYMGSKNKTEDTLKKTLQLHWTDKKVDVMNAYRFEKSQREKRAETSKVDFRSVDRLYFDRGVELKDCMQNFFHDELEMLDFAQNSEESRLQINNWVENVTDHHIKDLLIPGSVSPFTKSVLANAAYFKGDWAKKFNASNTKKEIFYTSPEKNEFVEMMSQTGTFNHAVNERLGCHILEMPYASNDGVEISMLVFLPPLSPNTLENLLSRLNPESLEQALQEGIPRQVQLKFPKMSLESSIQLVPILQSMGAGELFSVDADFSGFSDKAKITFDDAIQKAKIDINEDGSTAAAATAIFSFRSSRPSEPAQFVCNHPFMYMIYDHRSRAILFTGLYRGPSK